VAASPRDTDLAWVTPDTFRKTVATLIHDEADTRRAAERAHGHATEDVANAYYIAKPTRRPGQLQNPRTARRQAGAHRSPRRVRYRLVRIGKPLVLQPGFAMC
jgi:integrase